MDRIQLRRDTAQRWAEVNPILLEGEVGYEIDTKLRKIGDGVNRWNDLEYLKAEGISQETGNSQNITMSQDAITRELSELGSEVDLVSLFVSDKIFNNIGYLAKDKGLVYNSDVYHTTDFLPLMQFEGVVINFQFSSTAAVPVALYDVDNNYISDVIGKIVDFSDVIKNYPNAIYIRMCKNNNLDIVIKNGAFTSLDKKIDNLQNEVKVKNYEDLALRNNSVKMFLVHGYYNTNGTFIQGSGVFYTTEYLDIADYHDYIFDYKHGSTTAIKCALFDVNKNFIGYRNSEKLSVNELVQNIDGLSFIRMSIADGQKMNINISNVSLENSITELKKYNTESLSELLYNGYISKGGVVYDNNTNFRVSPMLIIEDWLNVLFILHFNSTSAVPLALYDANNTFIGYADFYNNISNTFDLKVLIEEERFKAAVYFRISTNVTNNISVVNKLSTYVNPLVGKRICFFGDSLMAGQEKDNEGNIISGGGFRTRIVKRNRMFGVNYSEGGRTLSTAIERSIKEQVDNAMVDNYSDYYILEGGVNDFFNRLTLGNISDGYTLDGLDVTTTIGALEYCIITIMSKRPMAKIFFMLPYRAKSLRSDFQQYINGFKSVCEKWSVPIIDFWNEGGIQLQLSAQNQVYCRKNFVDGKIEYDSIHISPTAYDRLVIYFENKIKAY